MRTPMTFRGSQQIYDNENEHPNMPTMDLNIHGLDTDVTASDELIEELDRVGLVYYLARAHGPEDEGWEPPYIRCSTCWMQLIIAICLHLYGQFFEITVTAPDVASNKYIPKEDING